jgi:hypothetical protein
VHMTSPSFGSYIKMFQRAEIYGLLGCYAASCGNCVPTFRDNVSVPILTGQESE